MIHTFLVCIPEWDGDNWSRVEAECSQDAVLGHIAASEQDDEPEERGSLTRAVEVLVKVEGSEEVYRCHIGSKWVQWYSIVEPEEETSDDPANANPKTETSSGGEPPLHDHV